MAEVHTEIHDTAGNELLDLVSKLGNTPGLHRTIDVPRIVVVGQQSSGKSSVLHAISGIRFPTASGLCTQFPTEIVLRRDEVSTTKAFIKPSEGFLNKHKVEFAAFGERWGTASLDDLPQIIDEARELLITEREQFISSNSLVLDVSGPTQEHLTLIDLPGLISSTRLGQSDEEKLDIDNITKRYVSQQRTTVLVVIPAKDNLENHGIMELLKRHKSLKNRTLGIITHPDAQVSKAQQESSLNLLRYNDWGFAHGWHVLRNLTDDEIEGNLDRDEIERGFFEQPSAWTSIDSSYLGNTALKKKLSNLLQASIASSLPIIRKDIDAKLRHVQERLEKLGPQRNDKGEILEFLHDKTETVEQAIISMLRSCSAESDEYTCQGKMSLRTFVQGQQKSFAKYMQENGAVWDLKKGDDAIADRATLQRIYDGEIEGTQRVDGDRMIELLADEVKNHRGQQLPNLVEPKWAGIFFRRQIAWWRVIANKHADTIYCEVRRRIIGAVRSVGDGELGNQLVTLVEHELHKRKDDLHEKVAELLKPYETLEIDCHVSRYETVRLELLSMFPKDDWPGRSISELLVSSQAYYLVSLDCFIENVANLAVEHCLMKDLPKILTWKTFKGMNDTQLQQIGGESEQLKQQRAHLVQDQVMFQEADDEIGTRLKGKVYATLEDCDDATVEDSSRIPDFLTFDTSNLDLPDLSDALTVTPSHMRVLRNIRSSRSRSASSTRSASSNASFHLSGEPSLSVSSATSTSSSPSRNPRFHDKRQ